MMEYLSGFFKHDQGMIYDTRQTEVWEKFFFFKCYIKMRNSEGKLLTLLFFSPITCSYSSIIYLQDHKHWCLFLPFVFCLFFPPPAEIPLPPH